LLIDEKIGSSRYRLPGVADVGEEIIMLNHLEIRVITQEWVGEFQ
jgi:hypothetical protein